MKLTSKLNICSAILSLSMIAPASYAAVINQTYSGSYPGTISGTLPNQATALEEAFTVSAPSDFTAYTTSYANGGFQPNLTLYWPTGVTAPGATQGAQPPPGAMADATTGLTLDGYLKVSDLMPGTYTLTLTDWQLNQSDTATNLSDGFTANQGNGVTFSDVSGASRTGSYAVNLNLTPLNATATPEPATFWLMSPFLLIGFGVLARKHLSVQR